MIPSLEHPDIDIEAAGNEGLKARHRRDGHWAVFRWPQSGTEMIFVHGHCDDSHYWTYEKFRTDAQVAVNARARAIRAG